MLSCKKVSRREMKHRSGPYLKNLSRAIHAGLRALLPVYKTTPVLVLYRDVGIPLVDLFLQKIQLRQTLRLQTIDDGRPPKIRAYGRLHSRIFQTANLLPISEDSKRVPLDFVDPPKVRNIDTGIHDIHLYTDGSLIAKGEADEGYVIYQAGRNISSESFRNN